MRAVLSLFLGCWIAAVSADVITTTSGRQVDCVILQETQTAYSVRRGYGVMDIPKTMVAKVERAPVITAAPPAKSQAVKQRIPAWSEIVGKLVACKWATNLQQIPATVVDVGVMRAVPYQSYRCGEDYEVNIYGDPDAPAAIEIGVYNKLINRADVRDQCVQLIAAVLADPVDASIAKVLDRNQDLVERNGVTIEITPATAEDAYGGWWISVYSTEALDAARAKPEELDQITVARAAPAKPVAAAQAATARATVVASAIESDSQPEWTPDDMSRSRAPRSTASASSSSTSGRVYVRGYHRKDGTYVKPHTRKR